MTTLLAHLRPSDGCFALLSRFEGGKAVLEILETLEKLGVAIRVQENTGEAATIRDVEGFLTLPERVEFSTEPRAVTIRGVVCLPYGDYRPSGGFTGRWTAIPSIPARRRS